MPQSALPTTVHDSVGAIRPPFRRVAVTDEGRYFDAARGGNNMSSSFAEVVEEVKARFWERTEVFKSDPFDPQLRTHKLSGKLKDLWSFSVEYDLRVIFYFVDSNRAVFVDTGTHTEVY